MAALSADLFDKHADHKVSVLPLGQATTTPKWLRDITFPNLRSAIEWIVADDMENYPYRVLIHSEMGDVATSNEVLMDLISAVKQT